MRLSSLTLVLGLIWFVSEVENRWYLGRYMAKVESWLAIENWWCMVKVESRLKVENRRYLGRYMAKVESRLEVDNWWCMVKVG